MNAIRTVLKYLGKGLLLVSVPMLGVILTWFFSDSQHSDLDGKKVFTIIAYLTPMLTPPAALILYYCDLRLEAIERKKNRMI